MVGQDSHLESFKDRNGVSPRMGDRVYVGGSQVKIVRGVELFRGEYRVRLSREGCVYCYGTNQYRFANHQILTPHNEWLYIKQIK